jgi:hypothetical protein
MDSPLQFVSWFNQWGNNLSPAGIALMMAVVGFIVISALGFMFSSFSLFMAAAIAVGLGIGAYAASVTT